MPYTFNGIGTWYWGKRNIDKRMDTCEFCGQFGELVSYDTMLYFVVIYLPIIPLGRKRIIDDCPACRRHRAISLKEYLEARQRDLQKILEELKNDPDNQEKVKTAVRTMVAYRDRATCNHIVAAYRQRFATSPDMLAFLADACRYFEQYDIALQLLTESLRLKDEPSARERMADVLLHLGRPTDAEPFFAHITVEKDPKKAGLLYLLVEGYQQKGLHQQAIAVLGKIAATWPEMAGSKPHKRYLSASHKRLSSGKPIKSAILSTARQPGSGIDLGGKFGKFFGIAVATAAIVGYLYACWIYGQRVDVYLVNGTEKAVTVTINSAKHSLARMSVRPIVLPEGVWKISVATEAPVESFDVTHRTSFLLRPFRNTTVVLNPDQTAILVRETTVYSAIPNRDASGDLALHTGKPLHTFAGIDYRFEDFPDRIRTKEHSASKTRIDMYRSQSPINTLNVLHSRLDSNARRKYIERRMLYEPDELLWLYALSAELQPKELKAFLEPRLSDRPIRVDWHRIYQSVVESIEPGRNLEAEYKALLDKDPENRVLMYLLGRITKLQSRADELYLASENGPKPIGYGYHALAYNRLCDGRFTEGLPFTEKAFATAPGNLQFAETRNKLLYAAGRHDQLLTEIREKRSKEPNRTDLLLSEFAQLVSLNRKAEIPALLQRYPPLSGNNLTDEDQILKALIDAHIAYMEGNENEAANLNEKYLKDFGAFHAAVMRKQPDKASECLDKIAKPKFEDHLLVYALASHLNSGAIAGRHLEKATAMMAEDNDRDAKESAAMLKQSEMPDPGNLLSLSILPRTKSLVLLAAGFVHPKHRAVFFAKARQLNFEWDFPKLTIDMITAKP